jgi:hypothetical protein
MKNLFLYFTLFLFTLSGCAEEQVDYGCHVTFDVENKTEFDIVFMLYEEVETVVKSGTKGEIIKSFGLCGKNTIPTDQFAREELMFSSDCKLLLDGKPLPDAIWKRALWSFSNEVRRASYTLTITNELIESLE